MSEHQIWVAYHQLYLAPGFTSPEYAGTGDGTLVGLADAGVAVIVVTGCATGPVRTSLRSHPSPLGPLSPDDGWEVVEEVSVTVSEPLFWSSPDPLLSLPDEAAFTPAAPGIHRVRVSGRGRSSAYDLAVMEASEHYVVDVWAEPSLRAAEVLLSDDPNPA